MNTSVRFNNAITALVKGYLKGTLQAANCQACAVGNIINHALGGTYSAQPDGDIMSSEGHLWRWRRVFSTVDGSQYFAPKYLTDDIADMFRATGYSAQELAKVEYAFEQATKHKVEYDMPFNRLCEKVGIHAIDADQLNGLHAVVDVLCEIEGITDATPYKAQFDRSLPLELV